MCCFAFLFLATALFPKNIMEDIRYILSVMYSARYFMTSEKLYQRGENANPMETYEKFLLILTVCESNT